MNIEDENRKRMNQYRTIGAAIGRGINLALFGSYVPQIANVKFQKEHGLTVVIWADGTKTFAKCDGEDWDFEKGFAVAVAKKALGNRYLSFRDEFRKWLSAYYRKTYRRVR